MRSSCAEARIGVIHAVVIGMMFTGVRIEFNDMIVVPGDPRISGREIMAEVWKDLDRREYKPGDLNLKELLNTAENHRIQRLFDRKGELLPVFWYIAFIGYIFTLMPMCLAPPTLRRCLLVALYSSMVALVLLGTFILTHPYSPAAGINPEVLNGCWRKVADSSALMQKNCDSRAAA